MDGASFLAAFAVGFSEVDGVATKGGQTVVRPQDEITIKFNAVVDSFPVRGEQKVTVIPSPGDHEVGSSKLKISNVVNFGWEHRYHHGQLVAVHKSGDFTAYGIHSVGNNQVGIVRVVHSKTGERALLRGMKGKVQDLAFSHSVEEVILGVVDEWCNLLIFKVTKVDASLETSLLLNIVHSAKNTPLTSGVIKRIIWCPFMPEEGDEDDPAVDASKLLVLVSGRIAEMWNVDMIIGEHGDGEHFSEEIVCGKLRISDHTEPITDACFSPDGTALATASLDGQVKFFQVYMHGSESPRCLHQWSPHDGRPVSSLFFLDNHKRYNPEVQFWKFAVTGAENNSEIKIWSCESWSCLQTLKFDNSSSSLALFGVASSERGSKNVLKEPAFKAALDATAEYLLLSDIRRNNVYVLHLQQVDEKRVGISSVSEFAAPAPFLSMTVLEAGLKKVGGGHNSMSDGESDSEVAQNEGSDEEDEVEEMGDHLNLSKRAGNPREATVIKLILVQPKSLQKCRIVYDDASIQPVSASLTPIRSVSALNQPLVTPAYGGELSKLTPPKEPTSSAFVSPGARDQSNQQKVIVKTEPLSPPNSKDIVGDLQEAVDKITLMSPEVFKAPVIKEEKISPVRSPTRKDFIPKRGATVNGSPGVLDALTLAPTSNGSSPSREVQDILAESEEQGGITADVIITEEDAESEVMDDEEEDKYESPVEEDPMYDEDAEFEGKLEEFNPERLASNGVVTLPASSNGLRMPAIKKEITIKQETVDDEDGDIDEVLPKFCPKFEEDDAVIRGRSLDAANNESAAGNWRSLLMFDQQQNGPDASVSSAVTSTTMPPAPGTTGLNRSFEIKKESQPMSASFGGITPQDGARDHQVVPSAHLYLITQQIQMLSKTMSDMASLIQTQRAEIQVLREEVRALAAEDGSKMKDMVARVSKEHAKKLEDITRRESKDQVVGLSNAVTAAVSGKLEAMVKKELKKLGQDMAKQTAASVQQTVAYELQQKVTKADQAVKESVSKVVQSKGVVDSVGRSLATELAPYLKASFRDTFTEVLIPGFERALQSILAGIAASFSKGTKEYEALLRQTVTREAGACFQPLVREVATVCQNSVAANSVHEKAAFEEIMRRFQDAITLEVRNAMILHRNSVTGTPSRALGGLNHLGASPSTASSPMVVTKQDIAHVLSQGRFNDAFQAALSAQNLALVVQTCEMVNPTQIFSQNPCPLSQHVLLSLIQQLGHNLSENTETKHKFLEEAIMNLEPSNAITRSHVGKIMIKLQTQLKDFIAKSPHEKITRSMKMLLMATESLKSTNAD